MKFHIAFIVWLLMSVSGVAQTTVYNKGMIMIVPQGTSVTINGSFVQKPSGSTQGETKSSGSISVTGDFENQGTNTFFTSNGGTVEFNGDTIQSIKGDSSIQFHRIIVNNSVGEIELDQSIVVKDSIWFQNGDVHLNGYNIDLGNSGNIWGETNDNRIYGLNGHIRTLRSLPIAVDPTGNGVAGIGLNLKSSAPFGTTEILRSHNFYAGAGDGGIYRYYKLNPTFSATADSVIMSYFDTNEVRGLDESRFEIWKSENDGIVWNPFASTPNTTTNTVIGRDVPIDDDFIITIAENQCAILPVVDLGPDTTYVCISDSIELDAENDDKFYVWSNGDTTQTTYIKTGGTYYVEVRDANGCLGTDTIVVVEKPYPVVEFSSNNVCQNLESMFINNSTIALDTMTFYWDFGDSTILSDTSININPIYAYDTANSYKVKLVATSDFGCISEIIKDYTVHPLPSVGFSGSNVCFNDSTSFTNNSTIKANQGLFSYVINNYYWDFGETSTLSDTSNDVDPSYLYSNDTIFNVSLIATSNYGCSDTVTNSVEVFPRAVPDFTVNDVCDNLDIGLVNNTTLSSGSISYNWDFDDGLFSTDSTPSKTYNSIGNYNILLTATTDKSCVDTLTRNVDVYPIPSPNFNIVDTCAQSIVSIVDQSNIVGGEPLMYSWDFGDGSALDTNQNPTKSYINENDYSVKLVVTSSNSCKDSISKSVTVFPNPVIDYNFTSVCEEESVSFQNISSITSGTVSYSWDFDNGNTSTFKNPIEPFDTAGTYNVVLSGLSNEGCSVQISKPVEIYAKPVLSLLANVGTCGNNYTLDAENPGSSYVWSDFSTNQTLNITTSGTYSVQVTNANGCKETGSSDVTLNSTFSPSLGPDVDVCDSHILDALNVGSQSYTWSTGETTQQITVNTTGEYIVDIVDQNGCPGSDTINVTVNTSPTVDIGTTITFCDGDSALLDAQNNGATYLWSTGETTQTIYVNSAASYSVDVTTPENCTSSDGVLVTTNSVPVVDLGVDQAVCDSITLNAGNSGASYLWSDLSTNQELLVTMDGQYIVEVTNGSNCKSQDTINITVVDKPIVSLGADQVLCAGSQITLDAGNPGDTYNWSDNSTNQTLDVVNTGTYSVEVENADGCIGSDEINVTFDNPVNVSLGNDRVVCLGQSAILDAGNAGSSYQWGSNNGATGNSQTFAVADSGTYWVQVTTTNSCVGVDTVKIQVSQDTVHAEFLGATTISIGDTIQFINLSTPLTASFLWNFDDGITSTSEDPFHIYPIAGSYDVSLVVSNSHCSQTIIKTIEVKPLKEIDDTTSSIQLFTQIIDLMTYPNPTSGVFTLRLELDQKEGVQLALYDLNGSILLTDEFETEYIEKKYDITFTPSGLYLLRIFVGSHERVLKILKTN